jgi:hypothetical protein
MTRFPFNFENGIVNWYGGVANCHSNRFRLLWEIGPGIAVT